MELSVRPVKGILTSPAPVGCVMEPRVGQLLLVAIVPAWLTVTTGVRVVVPALLIVVMDLREMNASTPKARIVLDKTTSTDSTTTPAVETILLMEINILYFYLPNSQGDTYFLNSTPKTTTTRIRAMLEVTNVLIPDHTALTPSVAEVCNSAAEAASADKPKKDERIDIQIA